MSFELCFIYSLWKDNMSAILQFSEGHSPDKKLSVVSRMYITTSNTNTEYSALNYN